eukprot:2196924-Pleurochrysis_carterae.AAC.2
MLSKSTRSTCTVDEQVDREEVKIVEKWFSHKDLAQVSTKSNIVFQFTFTIKTQFSNTSINNASIKVIVYQRTDACCIVVESITAGPTLCAACRRLCVIAFPRLRAARSRA